MTGDVARLFTDVSSLRPCYQARYHFLEKAAQNRMNQGPTNRNMSLKYKEQHESRRNVNQTHNPKVGGSNPPPATSFSTTCSACHFARSNRNAGRQKYGVPQASPVPSLALRSRLDPRRIVLRDVELFELRPRRDCFSTRHTLIRCEELSDEVNIATVRDLLESLHLVQGDVLSDEVAVRRVLAARDLCFSPAVQAIPDSRLLTNLRRHQMCLFDDELLRFTVARVVLDSELQVEAAVHVLHAGPAQ